MTNKKSKQAFTLIELLVVVAIIALLLSIIVPSLRLAKEKAQEISCRSNIRSLGLALRLYAEKTEGKLFSYNPSTLYLLQLADEIGNIDDVRLCPSVRADTQRQWHQGSPVHAWRWPVDGNDEYGAYALNGWLYSYPTSYDYSWVESRANIDQYAYPNLLSTRSPSSVPVFVDSMWPDLWPKHTDTVQSHLDINYRGYSGDHHGSDGPVNNHMRRMMINRHRGSVGISFLDGHVSNEGLEYLWSPKWHRQFIQDHNEKLRSDGSKIFKN